MGVHITGRTEDMLIYFLLRENCDNSTGLVGPSSSSLWRFDEMDNFRIKCFCEMSRTVPSHERDHAMKFPDSSKPSP